MEKRDYLERIIQQAIQAIAAIILHRDAGDFNAGLEAVRSAKQEILGPFLPVLEVFEANSAITIAGAERVRVYAALVGEEALIHGEAGDETSAFLCARRALELQAALGAAGSALSADDQARFALLSKRFAR
jgi:hypothetical protein